MGTIGEMTHATALSDDELALIDKYWRAANYLSVGQIYLLTTRCSPSR